MSIATHVPATTKVVEVPEKFVLELTRDQALAVYKFANASNHMPQFSGISAADADNMGTLYAPLRGLGFSSNQRPSNI